jgi:hypothetical protein
MLLAACASVDDDSSAVAGDAPAATAGAATGSDADQPTPATEAPADVTATEGGDGGASQGGIGGLPLSLDALGRDIAIEATITVATDDVDSTVDRIVAAAANEGGSVFSADVEFTDETEGGTHGRGTVVVKIPPSGLARLVERLRDDLTVIAYRQDAEDVTEQLVDLDVQIANARTSVERVRALLDQATNLTDVLKLETELTRRETDLERLLATQRNLDDRVALSTLTIEVVHRLPPAPSTPPHELDSGSRLGDALRTGWDALATVFFTIALVLATIAPFLAVAVLVALIGSIVNRRLHRASHRRRVPPISSDDHVSANRPE